MPATCPSQCSSTQLLTENVKVWIAWFLLLCSWHEESFSAFCIFPPLPLLALLQEFKLNLWLSPACLNSVFSIFLDLYILLKFSLQSKHLWNYRLNQTTHDLKRGSHKIQPLLLKQAVDSPAWVRSTATSWAALLVVFFSCSVSAWQVRKQILAYREKNLPEQRIMFMFCSELTHFLCKTAFFELPRRNRGC